MHRHLNFHHMCKLGNMPRTVDSMCALANVQTLWNSTHEKNCSLVVSSTTYMHGSRPYPTCNKPTARCAGAGPCVFAVRTRLESILAGPHGGPRCLLFVQLSGFPVVSKALALNSGLRQEVSNELDNLLPKPSSFEMYHVRPW